MRGSAVFRTGVAPGGALAGPWVRDPLWARARAVPSLDLRFATNKSLVDATTGQNLVTFTRDSSGTFVGSDGVLQTAATDVPRFDHNPITGESLGLLVEEARTNSILRGSEISGSAPWATLSTAPTIATTAFTAPDGSSNATRVTFAAADSRITQGSFSVTSGVTYTLSLYARPVTAGTLNQIRLAFFDGAQQNSNNLILSAGWQRITYTFTATATTGAGTLNIRNSTNNAANDVYLWGAQLEAGAFPTSYIPTTTAAATRSADVASITGTNFSSWYNQTEGAFFSASSILGRNQIGSTNYANGIFKVRNDTANSSLSRTHHYHVDATQRLMAGNRDASGISSLADNGVAIVSQTVYSIASSYTNNSTNLTFSLNGRTPIQETFVSINLTGLTTMLIGAGYYGAIAAPAPAGDNMFLNGHIRRLTYFPTRLSNANLQRITQ